MSTVSEVDLAWFCGLFEGEGSFHIARGKAKGLQITMTDLDVLEKVQKIFGGALSAASRVNGKEHWKDAWRWSLSSEPSYVLIQQMVPYLGARRRARAEETLALLRVDLERRAARRDEVSKLRSEVIAMQNTGEYTHQEVANHFQIDRTYVTKIVSMVK